MELPAGWDWSTLGETLPLIYGKGLVEAARDSSGDVPVFGSSGQVGVHNQALTTRATLIVGRKGSVGAVHYSSVPCWPIDTTYFVEESPERELRFFLYLLKYLNLGKLDKSTAIPGLSRDDYNALRIAFPPLAEQRRIVAAIEELFTRLDAGVAALRRAQAALKRYRAAVLKAAVEGRLTADWRAAHPDAEPASALLRRILAERRTRWETEQRAKGKDPANARYDERVAPDTAELPALPEGWVWATADMILANIQAGKNFQCEERPPEPHEIGVAKVSAVTWGTYNEDESKTCTNAQYINEELLIRPGDFLFSRANTIALVGACVIAEKVTRRVMLSDKILRVRLLGNQNWFLWVLRSQHGRDEIESLATGNQESMRNISQDSIRRIHIPLPPLAEQEQIVAEVERRLSVVSELEATVATTLKRAERLRQAILERAFSGRLVAQESGDEPISELLARTRAKSEKLHLDNIATSNATRSEQTAKDQNTNNTLHQAQMWRE